MESHLRMRELISILLGLMVMLLRCMCVTGGSVNVFSDIWQQLHTFGQSQMTELQDRFRFDLLWCGVRDSAPFPSALSSVFPSIDACCRDHDNCPVFVGRKECKGGVCNPSHLLPILHCGCEVAFRECLSNVAANRQSHLNASLSHRERLLGTFKQVGYFRLLGTLLNTQRNCLINENEIEGGEPECLDERCKREQQGSNFKLKLIQLDLALKVHSLKDIFVNPLL